MTVALLEFLGELPLILGLLLPVTESIGKQARDMGVFNDSRGILHGCKLATEEFSRIEDSDAIR